ncbi:MAG: PAS domain S-box protein [Proteobacteria bacterium]|nr:PAS domain S-box protein [Pseudomonadota bacterium]
MRQSDNIFDAINYSVCVISPEGRIIKCNRSTEKLLSKSADELNGHFCFEVVHGIPEPLPGCPLLRMKETNCRESAVIESDGRWLEVTVDPILDDNQRIVTAVHTIADITERKKAEEASRKNEDRLQSIFSAAPVGIGVVSKRPVAQIPLTFARVVQLFCYNVHNSIQ